MAVRCGRDAIDAKRDRPLLRPLLAKNKPPASSVTMETGVIEPDHAR